jgi:hypothetical protein
MSDKEHDQDTGNDTGTEPEAQDVRRRKPADWPEHGTVPDEDLPDELVPGPDNPLAEGLPQGETAEGLLDPDQEKHRSNPE